MSIQEERIFITEQEDPSVNDQANNENGIIGVEESPEDIPYQNKSPRYVQTQPYDYAVRSLMDLIVEGDLILNPDYQRNYRWDDKKASRFIESLILNIPVPIVYLSEDTDAKLTVIDGQQRLASLIRFTRPDELNFIFSSSDIKPLVLQGLNVRSDLNHKSFREISQEDRSALQKRHIRCIVILNESDPMLKFEVFKRLNTGSVQLTSQEIRNCIYRGPLNDLLSEAAKNPKFKELISLPQPSQTNMKDMELVLRFFAYRDLGNDYSDNYTEYLSAYMEEYRKISGERKKELLEIFNRTIDNLYKILGPGVAFRKPRDRYNPEQSQWTHNFINGAIYESQMIVYSYLPPLEEISEEQIAQIKSATFRVFGLDNYWDSIFQSTSRQKLIIRRTQALYSSLEEVINLEPFKSPVMLVKG